MHLRCADCGGPEEWCLDRDGEVWVRCMDGGCLSHLQGTFWPEEPIWPEGVARASEGSDPTDPVAEDPSEALAAIRAADPSY